MRGIRDAEIGDALHGGRVGAGKSLSDGDGTFPDGGASGVAAGGLGGGADSEFFSHAPAERTSAVAAIDLSLVMLARVARSTPRIS